MHGSTAQLPSLDDLLRALEHAFLHHTQPEVRRGALVLQLPELAVTVRPQSVQQHDLLGILPAKLAEVAAFGLTTALTDPSEAGSRLRMDLITALARIESSKVRSASKQGAKEGDLLLTTAEAAAQLGMSRPHVSMLCDQGKLGEVIRSAGGHRRILQSAVDAYKNAHAASRP